MKHLFTFFLLMPFLSNAQIVYTDIPDATTTLTGPGSIASLVPIDFDGNGTQEYNFRWDHFGGTDWYLHMTFANSNEIAGAIIPAFFDFFISPLNNGDAISSSLNFGNNSPFPEPFLGSVDVNNFMGLGDRYVGCKFTISNNTHYGWVRVNLDNSLNFVVKDYAYESTPNTPINAGDMGGTAVLVNSIAVQGLGGVSTITTQDGTLQMEETVLPTNATNNSVTWTVVNGTGSATISASGLLTAVNDGTVTVTATANDASAIAGSTVITISNQTVGISEVNDNEISIYPNPSSDAINIENKDFESITIYSIDGKIVYNSIIDNQNEKINVSNLPTGPYVLVLISKEGNSLTTKWIKN